MTQERIDTYRDGLGGRLQRGYLTLDHMRRLYLSMHQVSWFPLEESIDDPGLKRICCDCKEWWHSRSCPHIYVLQHVKLEIDVEELTRPVGVRPQQPLREQ
eukprot:GHVU01210780.1.p1 GENE.GHVU01210780.1~~GHVU01210780.1.p1  ORF type:complete len:118 (+),score=5.25 GHVU01210780.1:53-355(+)